MSDNSSVNTQNNNSKVQRLVFAALMLSLALVLPMLTGSIPQIGKMLLPMHFPVLLCGFFCGPWYGLFIGAIAPLLRFLLFGMPPLLPTGICMCVELCGYGFFTGFLWRRYYDRKGSLLVILLSSMLIGRVLWALTCLWVYPLLCGKTFTFALFLSGAFLEAWPGIVLQIILIPLLVKALQKINFRSMNA